MKNITKKLSMIALSTALLLPTTTQLLNTSQVEAASITPSQFEKQKMNNFKDIDFGNENYNAIRYLINNGVLDGSRMADVNFNPNQNTTREDMIEFIGKALGLNATQRNTSFKDVPKSHPLSGLIQSAYEAGIVNGYGDGTFGGKQELTRGHMASFISRAFKLSKTSSTTFKDVPKNSSVYSDIQKLSGHGITTGYPDGTFKPSAKISRMHTALFLARAMGYDDNNVLGDKANVFHVLNADTQTILLKTATGVNVLINPSGDYNTLKSQLSKQNVKTVDKIFLTSKESQENTVALEGLLADKSMTPPLIILNKNYTSSKINNLVSKYNINLFQVAYGYIQIDNNMNGMNAYVFDGSQQGDLSLIIGELFQPQIAILNNLSNDAFKTILNDKEHPSYDMLSRVQTVIMDDKTVNNNVSEQNLFLAENEKKGNIKKVYFESSTPDNYKNKFSKKAKVQVLKNNDIIYK